MAEHVRRLAACLWILIKRLAASVALIAIRILGHILFYSFFFIWFTPFDCQQWPIRTCEWVIRFGRLSFIKLYFIEKKNEEDRELDHVQ